MTEQKNILRAGNFFFRYRAVIAVPFFIALVLLSKRPYSLVVPVVLTLVGLAVRSWAAAYIGKSSRGTAITAEYRIINGPYRFYRHPIYLGNLLLVYGTVVLFNPGVLFSILVIFLFLVEYSIIIKTEDEYIINKEPKMVRFSFQNLAHELSTLLVMIVIYLIYVLRFVVFSRILPVLTLSCALIYFQK
jgi:protein-S-isoprenylcysteine O-methyltransferase Ste14